MKTIDVDHLFRSYDGLLIDAYGVLVDAHGMLPNADKFVARLHEEGMPFCIVTNDAAKAIDKIHKRFASFGLDIGPERIVSSASLLGDHVRAHRLEGEQVAVIGTPDARAFVAEAGAKPVRVQEASPDACRAIVLCEIDPPQMYEDLRAAVNLAIGCIDNGQPLGLVLCNPDVIYPAGTGFGLTSGSLMLVLEGALRSRFGKEAMPPIARLGKPYRPIFEAGMARIAARKAGGKVALMGDQLPTDIRGALDFGIDAVLVGTGLTKVSAGQSLDPSPTVYLPAVGG